MILFVLQHHIEKATAYASVAYHLFLPIAVPSLCDRYALFI
ncbi:hypothetical protein VRK_30400 [Vibrio sp. MEBiC08052]|nr:hypothetical protein VRK_30400 [Vibrio sp. MEBiC08052]